MCFESSSLNLLFTCIILVLSRNSMFFIFASTKRKASGKTKSQKQINAKHQGDRLHHPLAQDWELIICMLLSSAYKFSLVLKLCTSKVPGCSVFWCFFFLRYTKILIASGFSGGKKVHMQYPHTDTQKCVHDTRYWEVMRPIASGAVTPLNLYLIFYVLCMWQTVMVERMRKG